MQTLDLVVPLAPLLGSILAADVPVALGFVDYARRQAGILAYVTLSGDPASDLAVIARHYAGRCGKRPELASPIRWLD